MLLSEEKILLALSAAFSVSATTIAHLFAPWLITFLMVM